MTENNEPKPRQSNPFLPGWEPAPWQEKAMYEAFNSPAGKAMLQRMADDIDNMLLDDIKRQLGKEPCE
jgi:hypothetical protein